MDPLEKFKADFVRTRGEAYQPGEKPRPRRKASGPAPVKPTPAQNSLREFGDSLPGDELDNNPPHQTNSDPPPAMSPEEYGTSNRDRSQAAEVEIDVAKVFTFRRRAARGAVRADKWADPGRRCCCGWWSIDCGQNICRDS